MRGSLRGRVGAAWTVAELRELRGERSTRVSEGKGKEGDVPSLISSGDGYSFIRSRYTGIAAFPVVLLSSIVATRS